MTEALPVLQIAFYVFFGLFGLAATVALAGVGWILKGRSDMEQRLQAALERLAGELAKIEASRREDLTALWQELTRQREALHKHELNVRDKYTPLPRFLEAETKRADAEQRHANALAGIMEELHKLRVALAASGVIAKKDAEN